MRYDRTLARRTLLCRAAVTAAALYASSWPVQAARKTVVGFIYVGPRDDFGYNQAHAQGAAAVAKLAGVTVVEEEAAVSSPAPLSIIPVAILLGGIGASGGLLQRRLGLPDATVLVLQGILFVVILASEALRERLQLRGKRSRHDGDRIGLVGRTTGGVCRGHSCQYALSLRELRGVAHREERSHQPRPGRYPGVGRHEWLRHSLSAGLALARRACCRVCWCRAGERTRGPVQLTAGE